MAKKRLDVAAITNELQHSAFFPAAQPAAAPHQPQVAHAAAQADGTQPDEAVSTAPAPATTSSLPTQRVEAQHSPTPATPSPKRSQTDARLHDQPTERADSSENQPAPSQEESQLAIEHASNHAGNDASFHASMLARDHERMTPDTSTPERTYRDTSRAEPPAVPGFEPEAEIVETIRKRVRQIGKEISFVRLTPEEKRQLIDMTYTLKSQGFKTSENEISRIGINWLLDDYRARGQNSVLACVLAALNA